MKVLTSKDYRYVGRDHDTQVFERRGVDGIEELRLTKGKYVLRHLDLVFIFMLGEDIQPTYATESKLDNLYHSYNVEFGGNLSKEEFISKLIHDSHSHALKVASLV